LRRSRRGMRMITWRTLKYACESLNFHSIIMNSAGSANSYSCWSSVVAKLRKL